MLQERQGGTVTENDILDQIFTATSKLELMQTVLGVLTEKELYEYFKAECGKENDRIVNEYWEKLESEVE